MRYFLRRENYSAHCDTLNLDAIVPHAAKNSRRWKVDLGIESKRAVVTGGSRGIGAAISKALASAGVRMAVVARNSSDIDSLLIG